MGWYAVAVHFRPEPDQASLDVLADRLDYPDHRVEGDKHVFTLEAERGADAYSAVQSALTEVRLGAVAVSAAIEVADPRVPSPNCQRVIREAADGLLRLLDDDLARLRAGGAVEDTWAVAEHLPGCFSTHYTPQLVEKWRDAVKVVADKLGRYPDTYLASTAEELAGHAIISEARSLVREANKVRAGSGGGTGRDQRQAGRDARSCVRGPRRPTAVRPPARRGRGGGSGRPNGIRQPALSRLVQAISEGAA